ncbi:hypothetical protein HMPREF9629_00673 [Peptoanaerobacter stomatis]|uniref:Mobile element protein CD1107-like domain-containing protein n=1 Tax=Peptoanaerobacter stomatis TaxID=796937 RepID=G9X2R6_9FIRM|nr:DUF4366 domain-containing protein [Peptoanaerobacter stomatis]EHL11136.1 hypothetical protein HMPREF9629_00673 [Peptoanaerobacter stomatis]
MKIKLKNRRTQLKRVFCIWMLLFIAIIHTNAVFAQVKESEAEKQTEQETKQVQEKKEEKVLRFPNKLEAKEPSKNSWDSANSSNNTGIATEPSTSKAQLIENVNNANGNYPIHHGNAAGEIKDKYSADARQFITFKTKSGKTFHLIINHDEEGQNVMLLTEVSEDDLLNMVEVKEKPKEEIKKIEDTEIKPEIKKEDPKIEESKGGGSYIFLGIIVLAVVGAGYYFKIYKKKQDDDTEDEEEYDELEDEYEREDSAEDMAEKEPQNIDDMAIDSYDEDEE